jgi:serpin B
MKPSLRCSVTISLALILFLSACGPGADLAASRLERVASPDVPAADLQQLVSDNNAFAFDLLHAAGPAGGNLIYSPYSISLALAMTYGGARGETAGQMAQALHFTLPNDRLHPAFNSLDLDLAERPEQAPEMNEKDRFTLNIVNSLWGQKDWSFLPDYLDLLAANYGAGLRLVDFANAPDASRQQINDWVSNQTRKRIQNILPPGSIDPLTRLVLANAIYFKADWRYPFDHEKTALHPFTLLDGSQVSTAMMSFDDPEYLAYAAGDGWQAVALPYEGGLTEMLILVPDQGNFEAFASGLDVEQYDVILAALQPHTLALSLPKYQFDRDLALKDLLTGMGMTEAFDPNLADFSGMDGARDLYIGDVFHKAFVAVDEAGTEAAAATVVVMQAASLPVQEIILTIDRPFLFFIRDVPSNTILFAGSLVDPR